MALRNALRCSLASGFALMLSLTSVAGFATFGTPALAQSGNTIPLGINDSGQAVGFITPPGSGLGSSFLYDNGTFNPLSFPDGTSHTVARGINNLGVVVGDYQDPTTLQELAFTYSNSTYATVAIPLANINYVFGITDSGDIYGNATASDNSNVSFKYSSSGVLSFINLPGYQQTAIDGVSSNGNIIGAGINGTPASGLSISFFDYINGQYNLIACPGGPGSCQFDGINSIGTLVGYSDLPNDKRGFLIDSAGTTFFSYPFSDLNYTDASGINDSGVVIGQYQEGASEGDVVSGYTYEDGVFSPLAYPFPPYVPPASVPEPLTWAILILGFLGIGVQLRMRRRRILSKASTFV